MSTSKVVPLFKEEQSNVASFIADIESKKDKNTTLLCLEVDNDDGTMLMHIASNSGGIDYITMLGYIVMAEEYVKSELFS